MTLAVDVEKTVGAFRLAATFASSGGVTALFGRSGAGKTTLVNLIAGVIRPDRGTIVLDGAILDDAARRVHVPTHRRGIGYVFQEGRLFPHLSVRGNLTYARRFAARGASPVALGEIVDLLGIAPLLDRRPGDLSGGEKQRVAIGRALLANPRLLLMDEPLASLDQARKAEVLPFIERLRDQRRLPIVYVSHAIEEVARLADTLVLLADGHVVATGPVNDIFARLDLRRYTGQFEASVVLAVRVIAHDAANGSTEVEHAAGRMTVPLLTAAPGTMARLRVRARDVALVVGEPGRISIRNRLPGIVAEIGKPSGQAVEVKVTVGGEPLIARITRGAAAALDLKVGQPVVALVKSTAFDRLDDV